MTKQNKNNQGTKDKKAKPNKTLCAHVPISVGYVALLQNDRQNHTCFCICIHICCTGKGFHTHDIPCGWCKGCCLRSTCHSAGSGAEAEGPGPAGLGLECLAGCFLCSEYSCGHLVRCSDRPLDCSSFDYGMAEVQGLWERSSGECLLTRRKLPPVQRAAAPGKASRRGRGRPPGTPGFGFPVASWATVPLVSRADSEGYRPGAPGGPLGGHRLVWSSPYFRRSQSGYLGFRG